MSHRFFRAIRLCIVGVSLIAICACRSRERRAEAVATTPLATDPPPVLLEHATKVVAGLEFACALIDGRVACWGGMPQPQVTQSSAHVIEGLQDVVQLYAARNTACALDREGAVWCIGERIGVAQGTPASSAWTSVPERVALHGPVTDLQLTSGRACTFTPGAAAQCWGYGVGPEGQDAPGQSPITLSARVHELRLTPSFLFERVSARAPLRFAREFVEPVYGVNALDAEERSALTIPHTEYTACSIDSGHVMCIGHPQFWVFATAPDRERSEYEAQPSIEHAASISIGTMHACVVTTNGEVMCWGSNGLGSSDPDHSTNTAAAPRVVRGLDHIAEVAVGGGFACARTIDGRIACWGINGFGQSGLAGGAMSARVTWVHRDGR